MGADGPEWTIAAHRFGRNSSPCVRTVSSGSLLIATRLPKEAAAHRCQPLHGGNDMNNILTKLLAGLGLLTLIGAAQASSVTLAASSIIAKDTTWQDIQKTAYSWNDTNSDGKVSVGETVTFSVTMHKYEDGRHDFDGLKFWFGDNTAAVEKKWGNWVRVDPNFNHPDSVVNWTKTFSFTHTFAAAGSYDLAASVTCSADLSDLTGDKNVVTPSDWAAWTTDYHKRNIWLQGETEFYNSFKVSAVPEPENYAMLLAGLGVLGAIARRKQKRA